MLAEYIAYYFKSTSAAACVWELLRGDLNISLYGFKVNSIINLDEIRI
jgi:hypothetical protein